MIIVIGAAGFIGRYTVDQLIADGKQVLATSTRESNREIFEKQGVAFETLDITNKQDFDRLPVKGVEGVLLLGGLLPANAPVDPTREENADEYFRVNVIGTINVLEYCRKNGIRKVIGCCSYSDVAGAWRKGYAIKETEPRDFHFTGDHAVYVISKNAANDVMEYYNQQHGMQCAWFRFPPVYGVGPHGTIYVNGKPYKSGIQTFIEKAQKGEPIELWGDPHITRDIVYVKDVAKAFSMALDSDKTYGLYNMTSGTELDLEEQAKAVIEVFGNPEKKSEIVYRPDLKNNTPSFLFDMTKAKTDFGFVPRYTSYLEMMKDYKREMESGRWDQMIRERRK